MSFYVALPWPKPPITLNDRGVNPHAKNAAIQQALTEARWTIRAAGLPALDRAWITLNWRIPDRRRRDADNLAATLKVCQDALVAEGVLPDDSWAHVSQVTIRLWPPEVVVDAAMWLDLNNCERVAA